MPCHAAIIKKHLTLSADETVEQALKKMKKSKISVCAVIDDDMHFLGMFSLKILLSKLIPVSVAMSNGVQTEVKVPAAPGVAKRLSNAKSSKISELLDSKPPVVLPDAPIWEAVGMITKYSRPLSVVDENGKFHGLITYQSLIDELENIQSSDG